MTSEKEEPGRGFTVIDRRASAGEPAAPPSPEPEAARRPAPPPPPRAEAPVSDESLHAASQSLPAVDFASFVLSLATSALYHLGLVGDPESDQPAPAPDLPLARQTIDTLEMLARKTQGNLDAEEGRLLEGVLYELHLRYVEASK